MNEEDKKALGERVTAARKAQRLTQQQLADEAGVSLGVIGGLERGATVPQPSHRRAIAKALGEDVFEDGTAQAARDLWPRDVQTFTDVLGLYLAGLDEDVRAQQVAAWMTEIIASRRDG